MRNAICKDADMDSTSKRLKWARENAGYKTATAAAVAFGWTVPTYLGHENGGRNPPLKPVRKYARAFKVRWIWLYESEGGPTNDIEDDPYGVWGMWNNDLDEKQRERAAPFMINFMKAATAKP